MKNKKHTLATDRATTVEVSGADIEILGMVGDANSLPKPLTQKIDFYVKKGFSIEKKKMAGGQIAIIAITKSND